MSMSLLFSLTCFKRKGFCLSVLKATVNYAGFFFFSSKNANNSKLPRPCVLSGLVPAVWEGFLVTSLHCWGAPLSESGNLSGDTELRPFQMNGSFLRYLFDWYEAIYLRDRPSFFSSWWHDLSDVWHTRVFISSWFLYFLEVQIYATLSFCSDQIDSTKCSLWASGTIPEVNVKLLSNSA